MDILSRTIDVTDPSMAAAAHRLGCEAPAIKYTVEDALSEEMFRKDRIASSASEVLGLMPMRPNEPLFIVMQQQEQYLPGTQQYCDYWWVREHFEMFRFVCRLDDLVLITMRPEMLLPDQPQSGYYLRLPAERAAAEVQKSLAELQA